MPKVAGLALRLRDGGPAALRALPSDGTSGPVPGRTKSDRRRHLLLVRVAFRPDVRRHCPGGAEPVGSGHNRTQGRGAKRSPLRCEKENRTMKSPKRPYVVTVQDINLADVQVEAATSEADAVAQVTKLLTRASSSDLELEWYTGSRTATSAKEGRE